MTNRHLSAILAVFAFSFPAMSLAADAPPNLVVFISDDHGYLDSSTAGAAEFRTPSMERLARDGTTFTHAFAASPSCAPSRAALLTGLMPMRSGSMLNHQPPSDGVTKLPAYLQERGYEVVAFGKVAHYKQARLYGFDHAGHDTFHDHDCIPAALNFLQRRESGKPLCLLVGTNWPHVPWPDADSDTEEYRPPPTHVDTPETRAWRARYAAAVERFDRDLGQVYNAAFERLGHNTLFIHFSDHGAQWPFGKWNLYDAGMRVPFIAVWPGVVRAGGKSEAMLNLVDVLPTLVEAAGGSPPTDLDGRSFLDILAGRRSEHRDEIFATHSGDGRMNQYPMRALRTRRWKYIRNLDPAGQHHTHIDRGKSADGSGYWQSWVTAAKRGEPAAEIVARYHRRPAEELYDVQADPHEQQNLANDARYGDVLQRLRSKLDKWMREQRDGGMETEKAVAADFLKPKQPKPAPRSE